MDQVDTNTVYLNNVNQVKQKVNLKSEICPKRGPLLSCGQILTQMLNIRTVSPEVAIKYSSAIKAWVECHRP